MADFAISPERRSELVRLHMAAGASRTNANVIVDLAILSVTEGVAAAEKVTRRAEPHLFGHVALLGAQFMADVCDGFVAAQVAHAEELGVRVTRSEPI